MKTGERVVFAPGNKARYGQDHGFHVGVPEGVVFTVEPFTGKQKKLIAKGYGVKSGTHEDYGCGALYVESKDIRAWATLADSDIARGWTFQVVDLHDFDCATRAGMACSCLQDIKPDRVAECTTERMETLLQRIEDANECAEHWMTLALDRETTLREILDTIVWKTGDETLIRKTIPGLKVYEFITDILGEDDNG